MTSEAGCTCSSHNGFLTAKGLRETAQRELELCALDSMGIIRQVDRVGSVSGMELERNTSIHDLYEFVTEDMTDDQYRRFHNAL